MNRPSLRRLPPHGSTDWGAQQFYRVLDEDERVAAERERLRAMGWRPPRQPAGAPTSRPFSEEPIFGDERDAYADLIERNLELRRALDGEARRRTSARSAGPASMHLSTPPLAGIPDPAQVSIPGWTGGGRFGVPVPSTPPARSGAGLRPQQVSLTHRTGDGPASSSNEPEYPQVAVAPAVALGLLALGLGGGAYVASEAAKGDSNRDPFDFDLDFGASQRDIVPPPPPVPPKDFDPEDAARIQREFGNGTPNIPPVIDNAPEILPIQEEIVPNALVGPDLLNPPQFPLWNEDRKGSEPTRSLNNEVRAIVEAVAAHMGSPAEHSGGAQNYLGKEIKEQYLKNALTGQPGGGNYIDISFLHPETLRALLIQTVSVRRDGMTQASAEHRNNVRVVRNMSNGDILVLVPKLGPGIALNHEALADFIRPILEELGQPKPSVDPRASSLPEELWRMFLHR